MSPTEAVLQRILNILKSQLEETLWAHPSVYDNCPGVNEWRFGTPDLRRASAMPIVAVDLDREQLATRTLGPPAVGKRERQIPVLIMIFHAHRDEEQLMRQLLQLADAITQTLENFPQTPDFLLMQPQLVDFTPPIEGEARTPYIRAAAITAVVQRRHARGDV